MEKMMELQTRLGDADLIQPNRIFIMEGEFSSITNKASTVLSLFLFSDVLIVTTGKQRLKIPLVAAKVAVSTALKNFVMHGPARRMAHIGNNWDGLVVLVIIKF